MVRDAGGSRTHSNAALQAAAVPSGSSVTSVLARNRTWTSTFAGLHAHPAHPEGVIVLAARRGVEPRLAVSRTAVRSGTLAGCVNQYPDLDLNQGLNLRRVQCESATPSGQKARARGVEPREAVLEAAGSPRSTLVYCCRSLEGPPGYPKGVEPLPPGSQPGVQRPLHHRHHVDQQPDQDLNPELVVRTDA